VGSYSAEGRGVTVAKRWNWVAWGLLAFGCVGNTVAVAMSVAEGSFGARSGEALLWLVFAAFLVVGCLILARRPGNVIGWIFAAVGLLTTVAGLAETYANYAYAHPGSLPAPLVAVWLFGWIWTPIIFPYPGVPAAVVPYRPVAVSSLAPGDLAGDWPDRGRDGARGAQSVAAIAR
jgi:hypothetical protein